MPLKFKSKYRNQKTMCLSKHDHDSKLEANYCNRLLAMKQSGEIHSYGVQQSFDLKIDDILICRHIVDFFVRVKSECFEAHEIKSKITKTASWSIKHKLFKALYPHIKYEVIMKS